MDQTNRRASRLLPFRLWPSCPFLPPLDCLIVLGARLNPRGEPGRVAKLRLRRALETWRQQPAGCRLLLTGGPSPGTAVTEARAMADWALAWAEETWGRACRKQLEYCLMLEEASRSTAASAANTLPLVQGLRKQAVGLVSDALHIRRAHFLFRRQFARHGIGLHPVPARGLLVHYWRQRRYFWLAKMALREGGAWLKLLGTLLLPRRRRK